MEDIKLDEKICTDILINSLDVGQRKGVFSIKDAGVMYKVILFLRKQIIPKDHPDLDKITSYDTLIRGVILANSKGSYGIEEAALIDRVVLKLQELELSSKIQELGGKKQDNEDEKLTDNTQDKGKTVDWNSNKKL